MVNIAAYTAKGDYPAFLTVHRRLVDGWVVVTVRSAPTLDSAGGPVAPGDVGVIDIPPAEWTRMVRTYRAEAPNV